MKSLLDKWHRLSIQARVKLTSCPNGAVCRIAKNGGDKPSTVFSELTQVLHLKFQHSRWVPDSMSDPHQGSRVAGAEWLRQEHFDTKRRN
jgi:hypothetical protein